MSRSKAGPSVPYYHGYRDGIQARRRGQAERYARLPESSDYATGFRDGYLFGVPDLPVLAEVCPMTCSDRELRRWAARADYQHYQDVLAEIAHVSRLLHDPTLYATQRAWATDYYCGGLDD